MCGIVGILVADKGKCVKSEIVTGLLMLQHRGQDAAGMITVDDERAYLCKDMGLVSKISDLNGYLGIGHVRYPTAGCASVVEAQPFYTNSPFGIALAHNGNLVNTSELYKYLEKTNRHINTRSDSELLLNVLSNEIYNLSYNKPKLTKEIIFESVSNTIKHCSGGYAVVAAIQGYGLIAFRDPNGIRPLIYGKRNNNNNNNNNNKFDYYISSESVCLDVLNYEIIDDVKPGECVYIDLDNNLYKKQCSEKSKLNPCIFEYIYFSRQDSIIDHVSINTARTNMGIKLAQQILLKHPDNDIDIICPIPETSRTMALSCAKYLKLPYVEGIIKNRYIARTFIMPGQTLRMSSVRLKLNPLKSELEGKNVLLVDDSIVRGTTSREIVEMVKNAGANHVYLASASPEVKYPNVYGIDMPTYDELIAYNRKLEEIEHFIGCDWIIYNTIEGVKNAVKECEDPSHPFYDFDCSCFNGCYVTNDISNEYLGRLSEARHTASSDEYYSIHYFIFNSIPPSPVIMDIHNYST